MSKFYLIFVIVFSISFAQAGLLDDFIETLTNPRKLTAQGQCDLGIKYLEVGEERKAQKLFKRAAKKGNAEAEYQLAKMHERKGDNEEAFGLYKRSAEQGSLRAKFHVARMYDHGIGVKQDRKKASNLYHELNLLYKRSLKNNSYKELEDIGFSIGNSETQYDLSDLYPELDAELTTALREAGDLHHLAQKGDPEAQFNLSELYNPLARNYSFKDPALGIVNSIIVDQEMAMYWEKQSAEQGYAKAQRYLGTRYARGQGVERNVNEAIKWYTGAAKQGDIEAQVGLYKLYNNTPEEETPENKKLAYAWVRITIENSLTHDKAIEWKKSSHEETRSRRRASYWSREYQVHLEYQQDMIADSMTPDELAEAEELYQHLSQDIRVAKSN